MKRQYKHSILMGNLPGRGLDEEVGDQVVVEEEFAGLGDDMSLLVRDETGIGDSKDRELLGRIFQVGSDLIHRRPLQVEERHVLVVHVDGQHLAGSRLGVAGVCLQILLHLYLLLQNLGNILSGCLMGGEDGVVESS